MPQRWEYAVVEPALGWESLLNGMGKAGWEAVGFGPSGLVLMKRPIPGSSDAFKAPPS